MNDDELRETFGTVPPPDPAAEQRQDARARIAYALHVLAAFPAWLLVVQQVVAGSSLAAVEDGMGIAICGFATTVPAWIAGIVASVLSKRSRALAAIALAPASWAFAVVAVG